MSWGILDILTSVALLMVAGPPAFAGVSLLLRGNLIFGIALLGVAFAIVIVDLKITTPSDLPVLIAGELAAIIARPPEDE